jgi:hypothetical protein
VPLSVCGDPALIVFVEPVITVRVNGVVPATPFTTSWSPLGFDANVNATDCGSSWTLVVADCPPESVAVSCSSRYDGYS